MTSKFRQLLNGLENGPSPRQLDGVMEAVFAARRRRRMAHMVPSLIAGLVASLSATAYAVHAAWQQAVAAGLPAFLSVAATDTGAVRSSWQSYLLAVADAVPVMPLAVFCAAVFATLALMRGLDRVIAPAQDFHHA